MPLNLTRPIARMRSSLDGVADLRTPRALYNCNSHEYDDVDVRYRHTKGVLGVDFNKFLLVRILAEST